MKLPSPINNQGARGVHLGPSSYHWSSTPPEKNGPGRTATGVKIFQKRMLDGAFFGTVLGINMRHAGGLHGLCGDPVGTPWGLGAPPAVYYTIYLQTGHPPMRGVGPATAARARALSISL